MAPFIIENLKTGHIFKLNGKMLKHFLELPLQEESIDLVDPPYSHKFMGSLVYL